jgi:hypothetical protein
MMYRDKSGRAGGDPHKGDTDQAVKRNATDRLVSDTQVAQFRLRRRVNDLRKTLQDGAEHGSARHVADAGRFRVGEDGMLVVVCKGSDGRLARENAVRRPERGRGMKERKSAKARKDRAREGKDDRTYHLIGRYTLHEGLVVNLQR